jgi:predicted aspartyl protease
MKSFIAVFKQLNKLQVERKRRRLTTKGKTLLSIKHVKKVIDGMTHITSKHAVPS